jgi:hypothetical protein
VADREIGLFDQRDRFLDARQTEDPIHLMRVYGLFATTAVKCVQTAHPERCIIDPTQP